MRNENFVAFNHAFVSKRKDEGQRRKRGERAGGRDLRGAVEKAGSWGEDMLGDQEHLKPPECQKTSRQGPAQCRMYGRSSPQHRRRQLCQGSGAPVCHT